MFHWGLHAWGIYAIVGLGLAYMTCRYGRPLSVRWLLEPLTGRRLIDSWIGHVIDGSRRPQPAAVAPAAVGRSVPADASRS